MKIFILVNAFSYLILGLWCAIQPHFTASLIGLTLVGSQGVAEYIAVYGGLEFSIGIICYMVASRPQLHEFGVRALSVFYGSIVVFRSHSLIRFGTDLSFGWYLFSLEIALFVVSLLLLRGFHARSASKV